METEDRLKTISADGFRGDDYIYRFPFEVLDDAPGGQNLGRIEWHIELIRGRTRRGRTYIGKLLVWASQTRDKRYAGNLFEIACLSEALGGHKLTRKGAFTDTVWLVYFCADHKAPVFSAYPENHHSQLVVNAGSSISIDVHFE